MSRTQQFLALFSVLMIVAGIALGAYAWQEFRQAAILVEWSTATELSTVGFNLFRSESREGPFEKINSSLIPASPDPLTGGDYSYRDTTVVANQTYFYMLEDIEDDGVTERYGPIEVKAQRGGQIELALSAGLVLVSTFSLINTFPRRQPTSPRPAPVGPSKLAGEDLSIKPAAYSGVSDPEDPANISKTASN